MGQAKKTIRNTRPELATVISVGPVVIQLDEEANIQLRAKDGDILVNDQLVLDANDKVVVMELSGAHQYIVLCRVGGKMGIAEHGKRGGTVGVARIGDTVSVSLGTGLGTITSGSTKVKAE